VTLNVQNVIAGHITASKYADPKQNPIFVQGLLWVVSSISDTSNYPCDLNVLTITLQPDITLFKSCVVEIFEKSCLQLACSETDFLWLSSLFYLLQGYFELVGLTNVLTSSTSLSVNATDQAFVFRSDATWNQSTGRLRVFLNQDMVANTMYSFKFRLR
jgi:hypothetical protein